MTGISHHLFTPGTSDVILIPCLPPARFFGHFSCLTLGLSLFELLPHTFTIELYEKLSGPEFMIFEGSIKLSSVSSSTYWTQCMHRDWSSVTLFALKIDCVQCFGLFSYWLQSWTARGGWASLFSCRQNGLFLKGEAVLAMSIECWLNSSPSCWSFNKVARNEVKNASFAQRSAHRDSRIWRPELIEPAAEHKPRAHGRRPTVKSAYPDPQILPQSNISSNYPLQCLVFLSQQT